MAFLQSSLILVLQFMLAVTIRQRSSHDSDMDVSSSLATFPDLWFGLATAPAHVEVVYPGDPWQTWAQEGNVAAYFNAPKKDDRLRFLEEPEVDIDLAAKTGVKVFRMGVEWGRLVTDTPGKSGNAFGVQNRTALLRYKEICQMVIDRGMKVMMTLFHHALPAWSAAEGGWKNEDTKVHFLDFATNVAMELKDVVDYWVTFNEPHVFVLLSTCAGIWPPGPKKSTIASLKCLRGALPGYDKKAGGYTKAMSHIEEAHRKFYTWAHKELTNTARQATPSIGVAHNVAENKAYGILDLPTQYVAEQLFKFAFVDAVKGHLDWMGLNYYGMELLEGGGVHVTDSEEYSESGRAVNPDGFYNVLKQFHDRYSKDPDAKFDSYIITENGISDGTDMLRPAYIVEHLLALREAGRLGMKIEGYVHWTISDNWEWADGYCPKFGLVDVDRSDPNFRRTPRNSYGLFSDIVRSKAISQEQREKSWELVRKAALHRVNRTFCRADDGESGLDEPIDRVVSVKDWRFSQLSQTEDGCYTTPWNAGTKGVSMSPDDVCHVLPGTQSCTRAVKLKREVRCPLEGTRTERRGFVCSSPSEAAETTCESPSDPICCDEKGNCAPLLKTTLTHHIKSYIMTRTCPPGLVSR